eukprot:m.18356 g.18356  ORF g.18356 m.18356 type:complete len:916 (-) comp11431_c0_seq4:114-2861(-)
MSFPRNVCTGFRFPGCALRRSSRQRRCSQHVAHTSEPMCPTLMTKPQSLFTKASTCTYTAETILGEATATYSRPLVKPIFRNYSNRGGEVETDRSHAAAASDENGCGANFSDESHLLTDLPHAFENSFSEDITNQSRDLGSRFQQTRSLYAGPSINARNCVRKVEAAVSEVDRAGRNFLDTYPGTISILYEEEELWHQTYLQELKPATSHLLSVARELHKFADRCLHAGQRTPTGECEGGNNIQPQDDTGAQHSGIPLEVFQATALVMAALGRACRSYSLRGADYGHNFPGCMELHPFCPPDRLKQFHRARVAATVADTGKHVSALVDLAQGNSAALECFTDVGVVAWRALSLAPELPCMELACAQQVQMHAGDIAFSAHSNGTEHQLDDVACLAWACGVSNFHHWGFFHKVVLQHVDSFQRLALEHTEEDIAPPLQREPVTDDKSADLELGAYGTGGSMRNDDAPLRQLRYGTALERMAGILWACTVLNESRVGKAYMLALTDTDDNGGGWCAQIARGHATPAAVADIVWSLARLQLRRFPTERRARLVDALQRWAQQTAFGMDHHSKCIITMMVELHMPVADLDFDRTTFKNNELAPLRGFSLAPSFDCKAQRLKAMSIEQGFGPDAKRAPSSVEGMEWSKTLLEYEAKQAALDSSDDAADSSPEQWELEYTKMKRLKDNVDAVLHEQLRILSLLNAATLLQEATNVDVQACVDTLRELIAEVPYFEAEDDRESPLVAFHRFQQEQQAAGADGISFQDFADAQQAIDANGTGRFFAGQLQVEHIARFCAVVGKEHPDLIPGFVGLGLQLGYSLETLRDAINAEAGAQLMDDTATVAVPLRGVVHPLHVLLRMCEKLDIIPPARTIDISELHRNELTSLCQRVGLPKSGRLPFKVTQLRLLGIEKVVIRDLYRR